MVGTNLSRHQRCIIIVQQLLRTQQALDLRQLCEGVTVENDGTGHIFIFFLPSARGEISRDTTQCGRGGFCVDADRETEGNLEFAAYVGLQRDSKAATHIAHVL